MNGSLTETVNRLGPIGLTILVQVTIVLVIALALMWAWRRNPAAGHLAGVCGLGFALLCPVLLLVAPSAGMTWLAIPLDRAASGARPVMAQEPDESASPDSPASRMESAWAADRDQASPVAESVRSELVGDDATVLPSLTEGSVLREPSFVEESAGRGVDSSIEHRPSEVPSSRNAAEVTMRDEQVSAESPSAWSVVFHAFLLLWGVGVGFLALRSAVRGNRLQRMLSRCRPIEDERLESILDEVSCELGLRHRPEVLVSEMFPLPVLAGVMRPRILLPLDLVKDGSSDELQAIARHECKHIARRDLWVCLLQRWLGVFYWPQPLIHVLNRGVSRTREELCDNHVLAAGSATGYAKLLLRLAERAAHARPSSPWLSLISPHWTLEDRIAGILQGNRSLRTRPGWRAIATALPILLIAAVLASGIVVGREADEPVPPTLHILADGSEIAATGGEAPATPAAEKAGTPETAQEQQPGETEFERDRRAYELISAARSLAISDLVQSTEQHITFDAALMLLNTAPGDEYKTLFYLTDRSWPKSPGESVRAYVERLESAAAERSDETAIRLRQAAEEYERLSEYDWPLDWRPQRERLLSLFELILQTRAGEATSEQWQAAIRAYPRNPEYRRLFVTAYLMSVQKSEDAELDRGWIGPLIARERDWDRQVCWDAILLRTLILRQVPADEPFRTEVGNRLFNALSMHQQNLAKSDHDLYVPVAHLYDAATRRSAPEVHRLLETLLQFDRPDFYRMFIEHARSSRHYLEEAPLAKPVHLAGGEALLTQWLKEVAAQGLYHVWIDRSVADGDVKMTPPVAEGPWLQILESLLQGTPFSLHRLGHGALWIGPRADLERARAVFENGLIESERMTPGPWASKWTEPARMEFIETPLSEVVRYLRDASDISIEVLGLSDTPVTMLELGAPLHLALSRVMRESGGDWRVDGKTILLGSEEQIAAAKDRHVLRNLRAARFVMSNDRLLDALSTEVTVGLADLPSAEIVKSLADRHGLPLIDQAKWLTDQCGIPVKVAPAYADRRVSIAHDQIPLDLALDILTLKVGLSWETDGQEIFIGDAAQAAEVRNRWPAGEVTEIQLSDPAVEDTLPPAGGSDPLINSEREDLFLAQPAPARSEQRRLSQAQRTVLDAAVRIAERGLNDASEPHFLDSALQLLNNAVEMGDGDPAKTLTMLSRYHWRKPKELSSRDYLLDLARTSQTRSDEAAGQLASLKRQFEEISDFAWPLDWRRREGQWLELVELMMLTSSGKDINERWRDAVQEHEQLADFYRMAHLLSTRESAEPVLDYDLVKPLFLEAGSWQQAVQWSTETLNALLTAGAEPMDPRRAQVRGELFERLEEPPEGHIDHYVLLQPMWELFHIARVRNAPDATVLLETLLKHAFPYFFDSVARHGGLSSARIRAYFLAKPVAMSPDKLAPWQRQQLPLFGRKQILAESLGFLQMQVGLHVHIDPEVVARHGSITVPALRGPWLQVVEALLQPTEYRLHWLDDGTMWIGRPAQFERARKQYQQSLAKSTRAGPHVFRGLLDYTRLEFTSARLEDCVRFLEDQHDLSIALLAGADKQVTLSMRGIRLHEGLTHLTMATGLEWIPRREVLVIGTAEHVRMAANMEMLHLRRWSRIALLDTPAIRGLRDETRVEAEEATLSEVASDLSKRHDVSIHVSPENTHATISLDLKGITLEEALDVISLKAQIPWSTDGRTIFLGLAPQASRG